jgi:hypothetical protein
LGNPEQPYSVALRTKAVKFYSSREISRFLFCCISHSAVKLLVQAESLALKPLGRPETWSGLGHRHGPDLLPMGNAHDTVPICCTAYLASHKFSHGDVPADILPHQEI